MIFLNPLLLFALPLIAVPLLIHLINQRRHQTVEWGAMRFLLSAKQMSKGMARFRHVLIMAARMLVVAGFIVAVSRPMATGWFGALAGGKPETLIVLLDRSASMQQQNLQTGETKISSGLNKIAGMIDAYGGTKQIVLVDSATNEPIVVDSSETLLELTRTQPTDSSADIPEMMQAALDYIADNETGRTDVWLCSDSCRNDWNAESGRWDSLRSALAEHDGIRFSILNYPETASGNYAIKVTSARRIKSKDLSELVLDFEIERSEELDGEVEIPVEVVINGARSVINARVNKSKFSLTGNKISLDPELGTGWGKVSLPADTNASDNVYYFSFADQPVWQTVIVAEDKSAVEPLRIVCSVSADPTEKLDAVVVDPNQIAEVDWDQAAMVVWQAKLPTGAEAKQLQSFIDSGRSVVFFPPQQANATEFSGVSWGDWKSAGANGGAGSQNIGYWRNDDDVLQQTQTGTALPLDSLKVFRYCSLNGNHRSLAKLDDGSPLLARRESNGGSVYFCSTLPTQSFSSLGRNGVVVFAMLHRILAGSKESIGAAKQFDAGALMANKTKNMKVLAGDKSLAISAERPFRAGVYSNESKLIALNRPAAEDRSDVLAKAEIKKLFEGLDFRILDDQLGNEQSLASEIWRSFMVLMGIALIAEALLCLPPKPESIEANMAPSFKRGFAKEAV